ncbi:nucleoside phosphorylase domain-containing protein [Xylaria bambusicola]|uniref:nucleoside phosphorylase domain-containing protein n=1 Tax=Xylaria bambusicola TaxID=326684 RepID=UPI00200873BB|nr:nucleoside phosphorylase domain-containing protein [Xylaria bambusicola]KAI0520942.1 nucleoside phosphorylase domain-containing protein [Xylaria bambusicola]
MSLIAGRKRRMGDEDAEQQSKRMKLTYGDYTIGWVAALPEEYAAAEAMLDEIHEDIPRSRGDPNTYTFGRIGGHNVVIAGLPSDGYGTVNAATVANNMHRTFPSVEDFLVVGIAGGTGLTKNADVRLGDIVVGDQVIQYDLRKELHDQKFQTKAFPLRPSERLRTALTKLKSTHLKDGSKVPTLICEMVAENPKMKSFANRRSLKDFLFHDTYNHPELNNTCDNCDRSKLVKRKRRETNDPKIYYGVIASGNSLIKSPEKRRELVEQFQALCIEMEGAGIIESHRSLVIRSICDYADSHKNKSWQPYAAAAAAAFAKELILAMPISEDQASKMGTCIAGGSDYSQLMNSS